MAVLFFFLLAAAGITGGAQLYAQAGRDAVLQAHHSAEFVSAAGQILSVAFVRGKHGEWVITYRFGVDGRIVGGRIATAGDSHSRPFVVGAPVTIRYMPSDPSDNWAAGYEPVGVRFWLGPAVGLIFALCAIVGLAGIRRRMHILSSGGAAVARTTGEFRMANRPRGGRIYKVMCQFTLPDGTRCVTTVETREKPNPAPAEVIIVYDPGKPDKAFLYPTQMVKVYGAGP